MNIAMQDQLWYLERIQFPVQSQHQAAHTHLEHKKTWNHSLKCSAIKICLNMYIFLLEHLYLHVTCNTFIWSLSVSGHSIDETPNQTWTQVFQPEPEWNQKEEKKSENKLNEEKIPIVFILMRYCSWKPFRKLLKHCGHAQPPPTPHSLISRLISGCNSE